MMSLRWKIFSLALFLVLAVGGTSAWIFADAWQGLARAYGLSAIQARLDSFTNTDVEGWAFEARSEGIVWVTPPENVPAETATSFAAEVVEKVSATRLAEGSFELVTSSYPGAFFVAFKESDPHGLRIVGIDSSASLLRLSPWAAPFLGTLLVSLLVATGLGFLFSAGLNRDYAVLERALDNIGAGRLHDLQIPASKDPSVKRLGEAVKNTAALLAAKDQKIAQVSTLANEDPMTGIPNYRAFEDFIGGLMSGVFSPGSVPVLGIIDLDHFKKINDTHGHQVGDFVLRETTRIVRETIRIEMKEDRSPDFFGRYGGEEFVVIFTSVRPDSVHKGALRLLHAIKSSRLTIPAELSSSGQSFELSISASIGLATFTGKSFSKEQWVKDADQALYSAKESGRGKVVMLKPERQEWS
jgi:diguanylate cyclase (GGDEF)-like protein